MADNDWVGYPNDWDNENDGGNANIEEVVVRDEYVMLVIIYLVLIMFCSFSVIYRN